MKHLTLLLVLCSWQLVSAKASSRQDRRLRDSNTPASINLTSDRVRVEINPRTGALEALFDRKDDRRLVTPSYDSYALEPTPRQESLATEKEDQCILRSATFLCENPRLPHIAIEKTYQLDSVTLTKNVTFTAKRKTIGFLKYGTSTELPPAFYKSGYLNNPSRHVVGASLPYIQVSSLHSETQMFDFNPRADHHLVVFTNPLLNRGLAQYRFTVDGHFVHPLTSYAYEPGLFYSPDGWQMAVAAKWLSSDKPALSAEIRWQVFDGDHLAFYREYLNLPEFKEIWDSKPPEWMSEVKGVVSWDVNKDAASPRLFARFKRLADSLASGYIMLMIRGVFTNTRNYLADPIPAANGRPLPAAELQSWIRELHALSPRIKVGPITWQWAFGKKDPVFFNHPEWTVHGADGKPIVVGGWEREHSAAQLLTPECRRFVLQQYRGMVKKFSFDFIYMDTGQGGVTLFDWTTHQCAQDYDWAMLYRGIRDAARLNNGGTFFNGVPNLFSIYSDFGYYEGFNLNRDHWQALSGRLILAKLFQRPSAKRALPLYWDSTTRESLPKSCYVLALKPGGFDYRGEYNPAYWPMIDALLEIEPAELVPESEMEPCWWRQKTDVEAYALKLGRAALLTSYNHSHKEVTVHLKCKVEPLGLVEGRSIHVWRFDPKNVSEVERENAAGITEADAAKLFSREGKAPDRAIQASFLGTVSYPKDGVFRRSVIVRGGRVTILMLTQAKELAYARNGQPAQFLLPADGSAGKLCVRADRPLPAAIAESRKSPEPVGRGPAVPTGAQTTPHKQAGTGFLNGARIEKLEGGAKVEPGAIYIPIGGAVEATGLAVMTVRVARSAESRHLEVWINYGKATGQQQVHTYSFGEIPAGTQRDINFDLNGAAPKDWNGRSRLELKGNAGWIRIIFNSSFQIY